MKTRDRENLYRLFRHHGNVMGIARAAKMSLEALAAAVTELQCAPQEFMDLYRELAGAICNSEPKIVPLIHLLEQFEEEICILPDEAMHTIRQRAVRILKAKQALLQSRMEQVTVHGLEHVRNDDVIIVHMASSVVTDILVRARQINNRRFRVIALQLDLGRTRKLTAALAEADIDHVVAPEYNLSHHIGQASKLFLGAVTVTTDNRIVVPVGTANILSLCHMNAVRSYLFANSLHYSHGLSSSQNIHQENTDMVQPRSRYHLVTHSHDFVDLDLINVVVNETGVVRQNPSPLTAP